MNAMKKKLMMAAALFVSLVLATDLFGQAQITTRKEMIKDFTAKTTRVVLSGNSIFDNAFQDCVAANWMASPYEFCSTAEFEASKTNPNYYFLIVVKGQFRKETAPGIDMLTLVKGGDGASKSIKDMMELVTLPLRASDEPAGREMVILPVLIKYIQNQAVAMTKSEMKAYSSINVSMKETAKLWNKRIYFCKDDLATQVDESCLESLDEDIVIEENSEDADDVFTNGTYNGVISYVVAPSEPTSGSWCYKMLLGADTHDLYYLKRHKITTKKSAGFLVADLKLINDIRKKKRK
jgi:hypothetical protein